MSEKKDEGGYSKSFVVFICFIIFVLMSIMGLATIWAVKDLVINSTHESFKEKAYYEGKEAYIDYLENNQSFEGIDLTNISQNKDNTNTLDLDWSHNKEGNYLLLSKESESMKHYSQKIDDYNFYNSLCSFVQEGMDIKYFSEYKEPIKKDLNSINHNFDCIYDNNEFKIIYLLEKEFDKIK